MVRIARLPVREIPPVLDLGKLLDCRLNRLALPFVMVSRQAEPERYSSSAAIPSSYATITVADQRKAAAQPVPLQGAVDTRYADPVPAALQVARAHGVDPQTSDTVAIDGSLTSTWPRAPGLSLLMNGADPLLERTATIRAPTDTCTTCPNAGVLVIIVAPDMACMSGEVAG